jgi:hypothetical protein
VVPVEAIGEAGVRAALGLFFVIGPDQIPNIEAVEADLGRKVGYAMGSLSSRDLGKTTFGTAVGNAQAMFASPGYWKARRDVTLDVILPLVTVPATNKGHYGGDDYTAQFVADVAAGKHDGQYRKIFGYAKGFKAQWRLGQEADILRGGSSQSKWAVDEDVWRDAWHHVQELGMSIDPAFQFVYLNDGAMWETIDRFAGQGHSGLAGYPQHLGDQRQVWEYAYPELCDGIGMNCYINGSRSIDTAIRNMRDLDALGRRFDKFTFVSELGMRAFKENVRSEAKPATLLGITEAKARSDWNRWMDALAEMTTLDHHTYYEGWWNTSLRQNWPQMYADTFLARMGA